MSEPRYCDVKGQFCYCHESGKRCEDWDESTPFSRSRAFLPENIRKTLEASNLPIEVATAIADLCEARQDEAQLAARLLEIAESNTELYQNERMWLREAAAVLNGCNAAEAMKADNVHRAAELVSITCQIDRCVKNLLSDDAQERVLMKAEHASINLEYAKINMPPTYLVRALKEYREAIVLEAEALGVEFHDG